MKSDTTVKCGLSTKRKKNTIWFFFLNYTLNEIRLNRKKIYLISYTFRCLYCSNVWIDKNSTYPFFTQCLKSLRTRIIKFASLTYFQCSGTKEQYFLYIIVFHLSRAFLQIYQT